MLRECAPDLISVCVRVLLNALTKAVVSSFSCPAESQRISCEEMSPSLLSSCRYFIPEHCDTKLQDRLKTHPQFHFTSGFRGVRIRECKTLTSFLCSTGPVWSYPLNSTLHVNDILLNILCKFKSFSRTITM